jgi:hypothetical protein
MLKSGTSPESFSYNVSELIGSGYKRDQALAIAYSTKRKSERKSQRKNKKASYQSVER